MKLEYIVPTIEVINADLDNSLLSSSDDLQY